MSNDPERRIRDLERRLDEYHAALSEAIEQRDTLALDAAWGILTGGFGAAGLFGTLYFCVTVLSLDNWLGAIIAGLVGLVVYLAVYSWADRGRFQDRKKLSRLPQWKAKID